MDLSFYLNGKQIEIPASVVDSTMTLLAYLHSPAVNKLGTKGCASEGLTGFSTVMISERVNGKLVHRSADASLYPLCAVHGKHVTTIENVGSVFTKVHPIQKVIAERGGTQCGWCTPGVVMSLYSLLNSEKKEIGIQDIEECLDGNVCRCTGYRGIWETAKYVMDHFNELERFNEISFPSEYNVSNETLFLGSENDAFWASPTDVLEALKLLNKYQDAIIVSSGVALNSSKHGTHSFPKLIHIGRIEKLKAMTRNSSTGDVSIGAAATITDVLEFFRSLGKEASSFVKLLSKVANSQIRNVGTLAGNLAVPFPTSDVYSALIGLGSHLTLSSLDEAGSIQTRDITVDEFAEGTHKSKLNKGELITEIIIPLRQDGLKISKSYKVGKSKTNTWPLVSAFITAEFEDDASGKTYIAKSVKLVTSGVSKVKAGRLPLVEKELQGVWSFQNIEAVATKLEEDGRKLLPEMFAQVDGSIDYKIFLLSNMVRLFFYETLSDLPKAEEYYGGIDERAKSCLVDLTSLVPLETERIYKEGSEKYIGKTYATEEIVRNATGESVYVYNRERPIGTVYGHFVLSAKPLARIIKVDYSKAEAQEGYVGHCDVEDIEKWNGVNLFSGLYEDCEVFAKGRVTYFGQPIALVVANTPEKAEAAARAVVVEYKEEEGAILSLEDAIEKRSVFFDDHEITMGDVDKGFAESDVIVEGRVHIGGQDQFYGETQVTLSIPKEDEYIVYSASQNPSKIQFDCARSMGEPQSRVICRVLRMGGGFGGKQDRPATVAVPTTMASKKFRKPVLTSLDRASDMSFTGGRHPLIVDYKVGAKKDGQISSWSIDIFMDGGNFQDISYAVMDKCVFQSGGVYRIPNFRSCGHLLKTNRTTNTAFRGFGAPQATTLIENIMFHLSSELEVAPHDLRKINLWKGDAPCPIGAYYDRAKEESTPLKMFELMMKESKYAEKVKEIEEFNKKNRYKKRGAAIVPNKNAVCFEVDFMNMAGALVHIYVDGTVMVSHSGVEMGQSLNTKMAQIAAQALDIPFEKIHIAETATDKVPNTQPTAASSGTDLNGPVVRKACLELKERLKPIVEANPGKTWEEIITIAYFSRVNLSCASHNALPMLGFSWETRKGFHGFYYNYGVGVAVVEIDVLTGHHKVLEMDSVQDAGKSINPLIDIYQVEGGFIQGLGYLTKENVVWDLETGRQLTASEKEYSVPLLNDVPVKSRSRLLEGSKCDVNIHGSKATGEGPYMLANAVQVALREAINAARKERGFPVEFFRFDVPFTTERICLACNRKEVRSGRY